MSRSRASIAAFAIVASVLLATAPTAVTAASSDQLVVGSQHTTDSEFNAAEKLKNVSVSGSGDNAYVYHNKESSAAFSDSFEDEPADSGLPDAWEDVSSPNIQNVSTAWASDGSQSYYVSDDGDADNAITRPSEQPYGSAKTKNVSFDLRAEAGHSDFAVGFQSPNGRMAIVGMHNGDLAYYGPNGWTTITTKADSGERVSVKIHDIDVSADTYDVTWSDRDGNSGTTTDLGMRNDLTDGYDETRIFANSGSGFIDDFKVGDGGPAPNRSVYVSQNHSVSNAKQAAINISKASNVSITLTVEYWNGTVWKTGNSTTVATAANHTLQLPAVSSSTWRMNVTTLKDGSDPRMRLADETILFNNHAPKTGLEGPPDGAKLTSSSVTLKTQINDSEFGTAQGESVTVEFQTRPPGASSWGTNATVTASSNGTYSTTITADIGGEWEWRVVATDSYDATTTSAERSFFAPAKIYIRNETAPSNLVNGVTVAGRFFGENTTVVNTTSDGTLNLTGKPIDETLILTLSADGYYDRVIVIESLYEQENAFMLNKSTTTANEVRFNLKDRTGIYSDSPYLLIQKPIQLNGETRWRTVAGDVFGVNGMTAFLQDGIRHRLVIKDSSGNNMRVLGSFTPVTAEAVTITVESTKIKLQQGEAAYSFGANQDGNSVTFEYVDSANETGDMRVVIHKFGNETYEILNQTYDGPHGKLVVSEPLTGNQTNSSWVVEFSAPRNGNRVTGSVVTGGRSGWTWPIDNIYVHSAAVAMIALIPAFFGGVRAEEGALISTVVAGIAWYLNALPTTVGAMAIVGAAFVALMYRIQTRDPTAVK